MRLGWTQRFATAIGIALLFLLLLCPKWQLRTRWLPADDGRVSQPVALTAVTWHRWLWDRPADAAGIAWSSMLTEAGVIVAATVAAVVLFGVADRAARKRSPAGSA